jgi:hypothetical protein
MPAGDSVSERGQDFTTLDGIAYIAEKAFEHTLPIYFRLPSQPKKYPAVAKSPAAAACP